MYVCVWYYITLTLKIVIAAFKILGAPTKKEKVLDSEVFKSIQHLAKFSCL